MVDRPFDAKPVPTGPSAIVSRDREATVARAAAEPAAQLQMAFYIAMRNPRDTSSALKKLADRCKLLPFAKRAYYSYPRTDKEGRKVEIYGPSAVLAREGSRLWGNMMVGQEIIVDDQTTRGIRCYAVDCETNSWWFAESLFKKQIQRWDKVARKTIVRNADERELRELTERQAGIQSRNCILRVMPRADIDRMVELARQTLKMVPVAKVLADLAVYEITEQMVETFLGHAVRGIDDKEKVMLAGIAQGLSDGFASKANYGFGGDEGGSGSAPAAAEGMDHEVTLGEESLGTAPAEKSEQSTAEARPAKQPTKSFSKPPMKSKPF